LRRSAFLALLMFVALVAGARACADANARARTTRDVSSLVIAGDLQESFRSQLASDPP
jgi:hypothetical protein